MKTVQRMRPVRLLAASLTAGVLMAQGACLSGTQFRDAALPSLESGLNLILDGVVAGVFAAIEVESPSGDATAKSASR